MTEDGTTEDDPVPSAGSTAAMVRSIRPDWRVREARAAADGHHLVSHCSVETPDGRRECVLKATAPDGPAQAGTEARVLAVLRSHTGVPVPRVYGVVDESPGLPAPYFLMERVDGEVLRRTEMDAIDPETFEWIARDLGRRLAAVHDLPAVERFGVVSRATDRSLDGGTPAGEFADLVVTDGSEDWPAFLRTSAGDALSALADTEFADLVAPARRAVEAAVEDLTGPFDPALAHVDAQLANHVLDREAERLTGVLDWGFTLAATAAYDLTFAVHSLAGGPWWFVPSTPDRTDRIRRALTEGYRAAGGGPTVERYRANRECYELLAALHSAVHFADRLAADGASEAAISGAARRHRTAIEARCRSLDPSP